MRGLPVSCPFNFPNGNLKQQLSHIGVFICYQNIDAKNKLNLHICGIYLLNPYKTEVSYLKLPSIETITYDQGFVLAGVGVLLKGELKAEISNCSNIFFAKCNISEINFVKLFSLVYCFLRENYVRSWIFPAFATSSLWAQKLNQQPAVTYDMGKDGEERFRNQEKQGKHKWCIAIHHYG